LPLWGSMGSWPLPSVLVPMIGGMGQKHSRQTHERHDHRHDVGSFFERPQRKAASHMRREQLIKAKPKQAPDLGPVPLQ
jgi:hypothetical protein